MTGFRRLLVPHDLSDHADQALAMAAELAGPTGDLLVLHAYLPLRSIPNRAGGCQRTIG